MLVNTTKFSASEVSLTGIIDAADPLFVMLYVPDNLAEGTVPDDKLFALAEPENSFALTTDENVATPAIVTLSKFVCPSTSKSPFISAVPPLPTNKLPTNCVAVATPALPN